MLEKGSISKEKKIPRKEEVFKEIQKGVEDVTDAREIINELIELGEKPIVTVPIKYWHEIQSKKLMEAKDTWIPGFKGIVGTLGRPAYKLDKDRIALQVDSSDFLPEPRFTGKDRKFYGVVYFPQSRIPFGKLKVMK